MHPTSCTAEAQQLLATHLSGQHGWIGRNDAQTTTRRGRR